MSKPNLIYYHRELSFLREMGKAFAQKYPKIARRLNFMDQEGSDPHTERLIESFAFLTSYLQKDIENQVPRFSSALLSILYPHLMSPIPPMSIAEFKPSSSKPMTESHIIPQHFSVYSTSVTNDVCHFRTGYETEVWPIQITNIQLINSESVDFFLSPHAYMMKISLKALKTPFNKLNIKSLRFYINGTSIEQSTLYRLLFEQDYPIAVESDPKKAPIILPKGCIKSVGFDLKDQLLPCPGNAHPAYGLLQEYFAFPRKFMFFDLVNLDLHSADQDVVIYIPMMDRSAAQSLNFHSNLLRLGCTPIVNLFSKTSEPVRFDHKKIEYRLVPDYRREMTTEVHSIEKVFMSSVSSTDVKEIQPYFSYNHASTQESHSCFWSSRRIPTTNPNIPGTDVWMTFVNWDLKPELPPAEIAYASLLCTNRQLASLVTANTILKAHDAVPMDSITCLHQPTDTFYPPEAGQTQWQLISSLSVNYLSFSSGRESLLALKEILRLFNFPGNESKNFEINCLKDLSVQPLVRRMGNEAWRGFVKGTGITLTVDEEDPHGGMNALLFSQVLSCFFGLYAQINSFTELTLNSVHQEGIKKTWPARTGAQVLL